jgi:hypothetical protein
MAQSRLRAGIRVIAVALALAIVLVRVFAHASPADAHPVFGPLHAYLYATGPAPWWQDQVIMRESGWDTGATNPSSGAAGLAQFLWSTWYWAEGFCGIYGSPYDGYAAIAMMNCLLEAGQYYHWYCGGQPGCYDINVVGDALRARLVVP